MAKNLESSHLILMVQVFFSFSKLFWSFDLLKAVSLKMYTQFNYSVAYIRKI